jgi:RHS repeat-associated protein
MKKLHATIAALCLSLMPTSALSQVATGTPAFNSFTGGPDEVNLGNLNINWNITVRNKAERGQNFVYPLIFDSSVWQPVVSGSSHVWQPVANWGWQGLSTAGFVYIGYTLTTASGTCGMYGTNTWQSWTYSNVVYSDAFGVRHPFSAGGSYITTNGTTSCPPPGASPSGVITVAATDGSGLSMNSQVTSNGFFATIATKTGQLLSPPIISNSSPYVGSQTATDKNGNEVTSSNGTYTDTLGQTALGVVGSAPSNTTLSYANPAGSNVSYTVSYVSYNIKTSFGCTSPNIINEYSATGVSLVDKITLPDGTYYQFTYEPTPGYSGNVTGRPASVVLPTGGTISYAYSGGNNGIECADGSTAGLTRTTPDGSWSYSRTGSGYQWTTTATAPSYGSPSVQDQTVISFLSGGAGGSAGFFEIERQSYAGSVATGTLLQTILHCYEASNSNCSTTIGDTGTAMVPPVAQVKTTVQWPDHTGISTGAYDTYDSSGNHLTNVVYDYGTVNSGVYSTNPLQNTTTTYWINPSDLMQTSQPTEVKVKDTAGTVISDTKYAYDGTTAVTTSGTPQHTSPPAVGAPGNLTSIQRLVSGTTWQTASFTNFDTGNAQTATDFNGTGVTTYTYNSTGCANSFQTATSTPVKSPAGVTTATLTGATVWNCSGGVPTSLTDANSNVTTVSYGSDPFWRPASVTDTTGINTTSAAYPTSSSPNTASTSLSFNSGNSVNNTVTTTDSLGRTILSQMQQGPSATYFDSVSYSYDSRGRLACRSNPYSATIGSVTMPTTSNGTCTTYDALNRTTLVTDAGNGTTNGTTTYAYNENDVQLTTGPAPAGENTKSRSLQYNGMGQISSVCEITSMSGSGSCGQNTTHTGYLTKYTYDGGNLTQTQQNAQATTQTRTLSYDGLGRKLSESIPEWSAGTSTPGTGTYTYDSISSAGCTSSSAGDLVESTDNVGNVTCNTYDSLHRLLTSTVVSGTYASVTPVSNFVYDAATYSGTAMQNAKGSLAEAFTGTSGSKITDEFFSYSFEKSGGINTGRLISQAWQSTPHSVNYFLTTDTYYPNGAMGARTSVLGSSAYGLPNTTFGLDGEGRPYSATDTTHSTNLVTVASYNPAGQATGVTYGNGDSDTFAYDPMNRPYTILNTITGSSAFTLTATLTWNPNWSLKQLQIADTNDATKNQTCAYSADDLKRLASVNCGTSTWDQTFAYDAFGNIAKTNLGGATSYTAAYNALTNQVSSGISPLPTYDANGNQLKSTALSSISWNALGQPVSVTPTSGGAIGATYDALGRMVETGSASPYTQYVFGTAGDKMAVTQGGSILVKGFVMLPGGDGAVYNSSGLSFLRHKDWLGSSRLGTTWAHAVYSKESYAPFGETYFEAGTADRSFTGQDQDVVTGSAATGVNDFLFRKYDPAAGRWLSPDPAGWGAVAQSNPQSLNRYAYVLNNPMSLTDPYGLDCAWQNDDGSVSTSTGDCPTTGPGANGFYINCDGCIVNGSVDGLPILFDDDGDLIGYDSDGKPTPIATDETWQQLDCNQSPTVCLSLSYNICPNGMCVAPTNGSSASATPPKKSPHSKEYGDYLACAVPGILDPDADRSPGVSSEEASTFVVVNTAPFLFKNPIRAIIATGVAVAYDLNLAITNRERCVQQVYGPGYI